ncbi:uncharacterized protein SRS1_10431 [Sporisorium reilianum f. sp. reilianum]|uniref:Mig1 protein n=1 Tax=Sporisorium reilianum f. sp. reilianum TaxID=72559 RepID=A0A2N8U8J2_9BASI|nr:uncharacterized protein SRS1_10431 [Sporisorium reilianum f. sp. reilianum]
MMLAAILWAPLFNFLIARTALSAKSGAGLFDNSAHGQDEVKLYCSASRPPPADSLPSACFVMKDDVTTAAYSSSHDKLGFASSTGQEFVVVAPSAGEDSKVEFFASGFWLQIDFSHSTKCAKVQVRAPMRTPRKRKEGEEPALEPFIDGVSCSGTERKIVLL